MQKLFNENKIREELAQAYKDISNDPEVLELAEMGISDFEKQIKDFEQKSLP